MEARLAALRELVTDPTSNLVATALGLSILTLIALILVLAVLAWAMSRGDRRGRQERAEAKAKAAAAKRASVSPVVRRAAETRRKRISTLVTVALVLIAAASGYVLTSFSDYCGKTCHSMITASDSWRMSTHKKVSCVACHEGTYALTAGQGTALRIRCMLLQLKGDDDPELSSGVSSIPSSRCLSCHREVLSKTVVGRRNVSMSHGEVVRAGASCDDCHGKVGHSRAAYIGMSPCMRCHDGEAASMDCDTCHKRGADKAIVSSGRVFGAVLMAEKPTCGGCHSEAKCDRCHGLRMPHPPGYGLGPQHARAAAFDGKGKVCYRCHNPNDCQRCHLLFPGHAPNWEALHKTYSKDGTWCRGCHKTRDMCSLCHDWAKSDNATP